MNLLDDAKELLEQVADAIVKDEAASLHLGHAWAMGHAKFLAAYAARPMPLQCPRCSATGTEDDFDICGLPDDAPEAAMRCVACDAVVIPTNSARPKMRVRIGDVSREAGEIAFRWFANGATSDHCFTFRDDAAQDARDFFARLGMEIEVEKGVPDGG